MKYQLVKTFQENEPDMYRCKTEGQYLLFTAGQWGWEDHELSNLIAELAYLENAKPADISDTRKYIDNETVLIEFNSIEDIRTNNPEYFV